MKQFFKFTFASALGFLVTFFVIILILFAIISSSLSFAESKTVLVPEKSVLHMKLNYPINDRGITQFNFTDFSSLGDKPLGLVDILENIEKAGKDDNIEGIFLDIRNLSAGIATVQEIRDALADFKQTGKFIISYSEGYSQSAYYLASISDSLLLHPEGSVMMKGINAEIMFFTDMLEKLDVEAQIIRHGKYKSAVEPFMMDHMSEANKEQTLKYVQSIWDEITAAIAEGRQLTVDKVNEVADKLLLQTAEDAVAQGFADVTLYQDEVYDLLKKRTGQSTDEDLSFVTLKNYTDAIVEELRDIVPKHKIAIVFAEGSIQTEKGSDPVISSDMLAKQIRKVRKDSTINAIVLRVNSPGGSALASDVIWRETVLAAEAKPFVVSMGNLAASGGYYIACGADSIFANPTTITGSIGVFGVIPNLQGLLTEKIGLDFDNVKTNENAGFISVNRPLTAYEEKVLQDGVEETYKVFTTRVANGRGMTVESVDEIGQGRVWSGLDAKEIGLIDAYGGLNDAIASAARMAEIKKGEYRLMKYPEEKEPLEALMDELTGRETKARIKSELGPFYTYFEYLKNISEMEGTQARLPYHININ
ncbi:MAG TPA: signal peptide peptidase SppA [Bacteroidales bacterium]|nr:signal peptide peptidase SppA [Bacteroidales bacterium]